MLGPKNTFKMGLPQINIIKSLRLKRQNSPLLFKYWQRNVSACRAGWTIPKPKHQHGQQHSLKMHTASKIVRKQINSTLNTTAWGQQRCVKTPAAHKYAQTLIYKTFATCVPLCHHPVLRGVSDAGAMQGHWPDLVSLLPLSCRRRMKAGSDFFVEWSSK